MMMPANFSAISENEMTYVAGGSVAEILAPVLTKSNWQNFNTNMVTIIGNSFVSEYVKRTVGNLFGGSYAPGLMTKTWAEGVKGAYGTGKAAGFGKGDNMSQTTKDFLNVNNGVLNAGLWMVGNAAAIYNLARGEVKIALPTTIKGFAD